jgi:hypothetical protein
LNAKEPDLNKTCDLDLVATRHDAGGTPAVPANRLTGPVAAPLPEALLTVASFDYYDPFSHPNFVDWLLRKMAVKACLEVAAVLSF